MTFNIFLVTDSKKHIHGDTKIKLHHLCYLVRFSLMHQSYFPKFMVRLKKIASIFVLFIDIFHRKLSQKKTNVHYKETSVASNNVN